MNLFKFNVTTDPTNLGSGQFINGALSTMWVERYLDAGEFELKAPLSSGLRDFLPVGTLISHVDTMEVMIVENHQVVEEERNDPTLVITGRSFDTYLENRIVGTNLVRVSSTISEYILLSGYTSNQAVKLINDHIVNTQNANDALTNVLGQTDLATISGGVQEDRTINRGTVYDRLRELLKVDDLGVRTIRKNPFGIGTGAATQTLLNVYSGVDRTKTVIFSWKSGDFSKIEYLFSQKNQKNSAIVVSRYCWTAVDLGPFKYDRRIMIVDASDLDDNLTAPPAGAALTTLLNKMAVRGRQTLKSQQYVTIGAADVSNISKYRFRMDYNLGDLVMLDGNYGNIVVVRVVEYAEIEDENGYSGHPTLSLPGS
jgi:Siphovirus ReqiPepy6 Gp37-like protein